MDNGSKNWKKCSAAGLSDSVKKLHTSAPDQLKEPFDTNYLGPTVEPQPFADVAYEVFLCLVNTESSVS